jgi:nitroreductase
MDAITCLKRRRSIRAYDRRPVSDETIADIVDCGRLAATAMNEQPWVFVVVRDPAVRRLIAEAMGHSAFVAEAPVCVAVLCRQSDYLLEDGSAATENLLLAATAHGLGSCWIAGHKMAYASEIVRLLGAPDDQVLVSMVSIGFAAESPSPDKRTLSDVLRWERF